MSRLGALNNYDKLVEIMQKYKLTRLNLKKILNSLKSTTEQKYDAAMAWTSFLRGPLMLDWEIDVLLLVDLEDIIGYLANNGLLPGVVKSSW